MAERSGSSVVMEFSPSEVFIPHSKETLLQRLPLVAYVALCAGGGGWVGGVSGRPGAGGGVWGGGGGETGI